VPEQRPQVLLQKPFVTVYSVEQLFQDFQVSQVTTGEVGGTSVQTTVEVLIGVVTPPEPRTPPVPGLPPEATTPPEATEASDGRLSPPVSTTPPVPSMPPEAATRLEDSVVPPADGTPPLEGTPPEDVVAPPVAPPGSCDTTRLRP